MKFVTRSLLAGLLVAGAAWAGGAWLSAGSASAQAQATPTPPTIEQLAAFPRMASFTLSRDGRHLAAVEARGEERVILVWETDHIDRPPTVIGSSQMKIQSVQFLSNEKLGVQLWQPIDLRFDEVTHTFITKFYITDLEGRTWREPLPLPRATSRVEQIEQSLTSPTLLDALPNDDAHVLLVNNINANAGDVYRVDLNTNRAERIQRRDEDVAGYVTDLNGEIRARVHTSVDNEGAFVSTEFRNASGAWEEHFRSYVKNRDTTTVLGFTADPNIALVASNVGRDKQIIYEYDIAQRKQTELLFEHKFFDADGALLWPFKDEHFGEVYGVVYEGPRGGDIEWTSPRFQQLDATIRQALNIHPGPVTFVDPASGERQQTTYDVDKFYQITSITPDLSTVIFYVEGPTTPRVYYMLRGNTLSLLSRAYPDLNAASFGTTQFISYKARDGLDIPAFLTTPNEAMCGPGPWRAVVHPHGGPWARDDGMRFDYSMWRPLMASRCIAVLQPQYRGSDGWGRRLWVAGDAEWGQKMQDDKDDGAQWMIDNHIAQQGHIAMFGFSYGGYASMAAAVRPHGYYRCAIAGAGVSDIRRIWKDFYNNPFFRAAQAPTVDGLSPLDQAANIQIPIMVYHGVRDQTVPIEQSEWFVAQARRSGQPVEYHELPDYAHGPAWTRAIFGEQLGLIDNYFKTGCAGGL